MFVGWWSYSCRWIYTYIDGHGWKMDGSKIEDGCILVLYHNILLF